MLSQLPAPSAGPAPAPLRPKQILLRRALLSHELLNHLSKATIDGLAQKLETDIRGIAGDTTSADLLSDCFRFAMEEQLIAPSLQMAGDLIPVGALLESTARLGLKTEDLSRFLCDPAAPRPAAWFKLLPELRLVANTPLASRPRILARLVFVRPSIAVVQHKKHAVVRSTQARHWLSLVQALRDRWGWDFQNDPHLRRRLRSFCRAWWSVDATGLVGSLWPVGASSRPARARRLFMNALGVLTRLGADLPWLTKTLAKARFPRPGEWRLFKGLLQLAAPVDAEEVIFIAGTVRESLGKGELWACLYAIAKANIRPSKALVLALTSAR
jgi:hypothetical protein